MVSVDTINQHAPTSVCLASVHVQFVVLPARNFPYTHFLPLPILTPLGSTQTKVLLFLRSYQHVTYLNNAVRDTARPLTAPSLSNVTELLMKSIRAPKQLTIPMRRINIITSSKNQSSTFLRGERSDDCYIVYIHMNYLAGKG